MSKCITYVIKSPADFKSDLYHNRFMHLIFFLSFNSSVSLLSPQPEKDKRNALSHMQEQQQPSCLPPVRNPFKAPAVEDKDSAWKKMQGSGLMAKDGDPRPPAKESETYQKDNVDCAVALVEKERDQKSKLSDAYPGKDLPPGMRIKKKVSDEKSSPNGNGGGKVQDKARKDDYQKSGEAEKKISSSSAKALQAETGSRTTLLKHSDLKKPTDDKTCAELSNPTDDKTPDESPPSSFTQASKDSANSHRTSNKQSRSADSHRSSKSQDDDDDDDVVLVSVNAVAQKSPVTAVQTTLTTFPGFNPASKVKSQDDPRGLRGLLTAQLQQKKVSGKVEISCVLRSFHDSCSPCNGSHFCFSIFSFTFLLVLRPLCLW